jgi:methylenetetrahydrofolate--tRNA-(uracil-5-)-methyltransferase
MAGIELTVIGGGLAGSEAAWQAAQCGVQVILYEMRPDRPTPAHQTDRLAELVCSNSFGARSLDHALGLLKEEMRRLGSLIIACADASGLPAGEALAVDRECFSQAVTERILDHPNIRVQRAEITRFPDGPVIVASGPLTSDALAAQIANLAGQANLCFFDAMAPIVEAGSINMQVAFRANRYGHGQQLDGDYINCPMSEEEYRRFVDALLAAPVIPLRDFERNDRRFFEACLPVEVLAGRDRAALTFGPLRPVGLTDPRTGRRPHAVVQLRQDNRAATLYNMVGFQTNLRWSAQREVFRMIPGLERAEFVRYGQMHRNTFVCSPLLLDVTLRVRTRPDGAAPAIWLAGQLTGTEGYVGSAMSGLVAGLNAARFLHNLPPLVFPATTMIGALLQYISTAEPQGFQPMKAAFGLLPPLERPVLSRRERHLAHGRRALADLQPVLGQLEAMGDLTSAGQGRNEPP